MKTLMKTLVVLVAVTFVMTSCDQSAFDDITPDRIENPGNPGGNTGGDNTGGDNTGGDNTGGDNTGNNGSGNNGSGNNGGGTPNYGSGIQGAIQHAQNLLDGRVSESDSDQDWGVSVYKVEITTRSNAEVDFMFKASDNSLRKIQHDNGPINYDINPGNGLVKLSTALQAAKSKANSSNITEFELDKDVWWGPKYGNKWVYAVEFDDDYRVIVDAKTGNTLGFATWN